MVQNKNKQPRYIKVGDGPLIKSTSEKGRLYFKNKLVLANKT